MACSTALPTSKPSQITDAALSIISENHLYLSSERTIYSKALYEAPSCEALFSPNSCTPSNKTDLEIFQELQTELNVSQTDIIDLLLSRLDPYSHLATEEEKSFLFKEDEPSVFMAHASAFATIRIDEFRSNTHTELEQALRDTALLHGEKLEAIILDIRGNSGGLVDQAALSADLFLPKGKSLFTHTQRRFPHQTEYQSNSVDQTYGTPLYVLIDKNTASAAEAFALTLMEHKRAILLGEPSKGKGLSQTIFSLPDHHVLFLTTGYLSYGDNRQIEDIGASPQICFVKNKILQGNDCTLKDSQPQEYPKLLKIINFLQESPEKYKLLLEKQKHFAYKQ